MGGDSDRSTRNNTSKPPSLEWGLFASKAMEAKNPSRKGWQDRTPAGVMAISQLCGRDRSNFADPDRIRFKTFELVRELTVEYLRDLGSIICRDIQALILDRPYYLADPEDFANFEEAGGIRTNVLTWLGKLPSLPFSFSWRKACLLSPAIHQHLTFSTICF